MLWAADVCSRASFAQPGPVSSISLGRFFSVRVRRGFKSSYAVEEYLKEEN